MLDGLSNKIGPLPVWAWGGLGAAGLFFLMARNKSSSPPLPNNMPVPSTADTAAAMGGAQLANIWQLTSDNNNALQTLSQQQAKGVTAAHADMANENLQILSWIDGLRGLVVQQGDKGTALAHADASNQNLQLLDWIENLRGLVVQRTGGNPYGSPGTEWLNTPPPLATSQLTPMMNSAATPSPMGAWYNGAPGAYTSMYGFSPN